MAKAGHPTTVRVTGTAVALASEPTTEVVADTVFQITDAAKRILDPSVPVVVQVDADGGGAGAYATVAASTYTVDHLFGRITFATPLASAATVRILSGSYLPTLAVVGAREFTISASRTVLDRTEFGDDAKKKLAGLADLSGSIGSLDDLLSDVDPGAGSLKLVEMLSNATPKLIEIRPAASGDKFRAWVLFESEEVAGAVDDLITSTLTYTGAAVQGDNGSASFGWGS